MKQTKLYFLTLLLLFVLNSGAYSQENAKLPDTHAGKVAQSFFEAFNSDDRAKMEKFIAERRTPSALKRISVEDRMKMFDRQKEMIRTFSSITIVEEDTLSLSVMTYSEAVEAWFKLGFELSGESGLLEGFSMRPGRAPKAQSNDRYGSWKNLNQLLDNVVEKEGVPGIAMVTISGGKIDQTGVAGVRKAGMADPIQKNDRFHLGSIAKSMTATVVGKLIETNRLSFDATLENLFPEIDMLPAYEEVTVRQLLDHRGGIPVYLTTSEEEEAKLLALPGSPAEQRAAFMKLVLKQEPSSKQGAFAYSNAGYSILATICEQLTEESWEELLAKYVFDPLKMKTTGFGWPDDLDPAQPSGHSGPLSDLKSQEADYILGPYIDPAGDIHCSMKDLATYALAHLKGLEGKSGILKAETFKALHQAGEGSNYAGGWIIYPSEKGQEVHEHAGSAGTFMAYMRIDPETGNGWVIAANAGDLSLDGIFRELVTLTSK